MTGALMSPPTSGKSSAGAPLDVPGAWVHRWNWGLTFALTVMIAPTMFGRESMISPPDPLKNNFAKGVEAIALGLLILWMVRHRWMPRLNLPMTLATLFVSLCMVSGFWADDFSGFKSQIQKLVHSYATTIAVYIGIRSRADLENSVLVWKSISFVYAFLMLSELFVPRSWLPKAEADTVIKGLTFYRIDGPGGHSNWAGFFLGTTMCLQPYFWARYTSRRARAILVIVTLTEVTALIEAHVRLGVIGVIVGSTWWVIRGGFGSRVKPVVFAVCAVVLAWPFIPQTWKMRSVNENLLEQDHSIQVRWSMQLESSRLAWENAAFGTGYGGFGRLLWEEGTGLALEQNLYNFDRDGYERNAPKWIATIGSHNAYTEILTESGLLGSMLFIGMVVMLQLGLFSCSHRNKGDPAAQQMGMCFESQMWALVVMLIILHAQERRCFWMLIAVGSSYIALTRRGMMGTAPPPSGGVPRSAVRFAVSATVMFALLAMVFLLIVSVSRYGAVPEWAR